MKPYSAQRLFHETDPFPTFRPSSYLLLLPLAPAEGTAAAGGGDEEGLGGGNSLKISLGAPLWEGRGRRVGTREGREGPQSLILPVGLVAPKPPTRELPYTLHVTCASKKRSFFSRRIFCERGSRWNLFSLASPLVRQRGRWKESWFLSVEEEEEV